MLYLTGEAQVRAVQGGFEGHALEQVRNACIFRFLCLKKTVMDRNQTKRARANRALIIRRRDEVVERTSADG
jgi:hypothetical protein